MDIFAPMLSRLYPSRRRSTGSGCLSVSLTQVKSVEFVKKELGSSSIECVLSSPFSVVFLFLPPVQVVSIMVRLISLPGGKHLKLLWRVGYFR